MVVTVAPDATFTWEYSASRVSSKNSVARRLPWSKSLTAESSVVQERSGARSGSLLTMSPCEIEPWYSSDTVGRRTARPRDAFNVVIGVAAHESASFGDHQVPERESKGSVCVA